MDVNVKTQISILVGTMTGTAQLCAQEMELALGDDDTEVATLLMDDLDASVFSRPGVFLICTSTYGQGDVPDNAKNFYEDLKAKRPDLARVRYGVFGLGDRTYAETFNFGGKRFDELLSELGAEARMHPAPDRREPLDDQLALGRLADRARDRTLHQVQPEHQRQGKQDNQDQDGPAKPFQGAHAPSRAKRVP